MSGRRYAAPFKGDRDALIAEYRRLVGEGSIEFTTFHQSMSYEEFVEGLRPVADAEQEMETSAGFRLDPVPGIFYRISKRAEVRTGGAPDQDLAKEVQHDLVTLEGRNVHQMSLGPDDPVRGFRWHNSSGASLHDQRAHRVSIRPRTSDRPCLSAMPISPAATAGPMSRT